MRKVDPITYEVIRCNLLSIANEMKTAMSRAAYSPLWKEAGDMSAGVLTAKGETVSLGEVDQPAQLMTLGLSAASAMAKIKDIEEGDVVFHNDPYSGSNHLNDFVMVKPVFYKGEIIVLAGTIGHTVDVGGMSPGSYTSTGDIYSEGLRIPPVKLFERGKLNETIVDIIMANTRVSWERRGDLMSMYTGCLAGERRLIYLAEKYGVETLMTYMDEIMDHSENMTRAEIEKIPSGTYSCEDYADRDVLSPEEKPIKIKATVTVKGSDVKIDFTGTDKQTIGGNNVPLAVTHAACFYAIRCITDPWNPANSGCFRPVKIHVHEGTVLNPRFPAPVAYGNHETSCRVWDVVLGALSQACPERVTAAHCGSSCILFWGGWNPRTNKEYVHLEVHGSAHGAAYNHDGVTAKRTGMGNTCNTPVEAIETHYPMRIHSQYIVADWGGAGRYRGGQPIRRVYEFLEDSKLTVIAERERFFPWGLFGGKPARRARFVLYRTSGEVEHLPSKTELIRVQRGCRLEFNSAGGGGFGDPFERDPNLVLKDVIYGYISPESAKDDYGVVVRFNPATQSFDIDMKETLKYRKEAKL